MSGIALGPAEVALPSVSRRRVLAAVGVVGAAAVATTLPVRLGAHSPSLTPDAVLRASTFAALVGSSFTLELDGDGPVALTLVAVEGVGAAAATDDVFTLRLRGPMASRQGGQVGHLSASGIPRTPLLVVPSGRPDPGGQDWVVTVVRGAE